MEAWLPSRPCVVERSMEAFGNNPASVLGDRLAGEPRPTLQADEEDTPVRCATAGERRTGQPGTGGGETFAHTLDSACGPASPSNTGRRTMAVRTAMLALAAITIAAAALSVVWTG